MNKERVVHHYNSQVVGWLEITANEEALEALSFVETPERPLDGSSNPVVRQLVKELDRYFAGEPTTFTVPLASEGASPFQRRVWDALKEIPYGTTASYGQIAKAVGNPKACRAVGSANGSNRIPIVIPCHRVIKSDGKLGGFGSGVAVKKRLLELEGVTEFS